MTPRVKPADLGTASRLDLMPSTKTIHPSFYLSLLPSPRPLVLFCIPPPTMHVSCPIHSPATAMYLHLHSLIEQLWILQYLKPEGYEIPTGCLHLTYSVQCKAFTHLNGCVLLSERLCFNAEYISPEMSAKKGQTKQVYPGQGASSPGFAAAQSHDRWTTRAILLPPCV